MDRVFPLGLPIATQTYLVLYLVTLTAHFVLVSYVVAGSLWLTVDRSVGRRRANDGEVGLIPATISDWLPFSLGAAITAGVAPLLFVQIVYKSSFYTANLLLFYRWMLILPVLIAGFYLLYVGKTSWMQTRPRGAQIAIRFAALACFLFTGWSWTENHILSLDREVWPEFCASSRWVYTHASLVPRCAAWLSASIPTMAMVVGWQLHDRAVREKRAVARDVRLLAAVALCGLASTAVCLWWYGSVLELRIRDLLHEPIAEPYRWIAAAALALEGGGWLAAAVSRKLSRTLLAAITLGALGFTASACVLREVLRLGVKDLSSLTALHERAARIGGLGVFLVFALLNAVAVTACVVFARRGLRANAASSDPPTRHGSSSL